MWLWVNWEKTTSCGGSSGAAAIKDWELENRRCWRRFRIAEGGGDARVSSRSVKNAVLHDLTANDDDEDDDDSDDILATSKFHPSDTISIFILASLVCFFQFSELLLLILPHSPTFRTTPPSTLLCSLWLQLPQWALFISLIGPHLSKQSFGSAR